MRRGAVYRSGRLSDLKGDDRLFLDRAKIKTIFDLRARPEREADPTAWCGEDTETYVFKTGLKRRLVDMAQDFPATPHGAQALMLHFYAELPRTMGHAFGEILLRISQGALPCIIHCSAGKDRTGLAVALLLSALGFGREAIVTDYVASTKAHRLESAVARSVERDEAVASFRARYPAGARAVLIEARGAYILTALDAIEAHHGGMAAYLASIGVDDTVIARLRARLLEPVERGDAA